MLGPVLFLLNIDCIPNDVMATGKIFADYLKLYGSNEMGCVEGMTDVMQHVQNDIDTLLQVSKSWGLTLNPSNVLQLYRCTRSNAVPYRLIWVRIHMLIIPLFPFKDLVTNLRITVDSKLKFH